MINWVEWALLQVEQEANEMEFGTGFVKAVDSKSGEDALGTPSGLLSRSAIEDLIQGDLPVWDTSGWTGEAQMGGLDVQLRSEVKNLYNGNVTGVATEGQMKTNGFEVESKKSGSIENSNFLADSEKARLDAMAVAFKKLSGGAEVDWSQSLRMADGDLGEVGARSTSESWLESMGKVRTAVEQLQMPKSNQEMISSAGVAVSGESGWNPWQLDQVVQRDARRYDSGFSLY